MQKSTKPKKLSIHWENGEKALFYYSFLIGVRLYLDGEVNVMTLKFMGETLVLKGYNLDLLFTVFESQEPKIIEVRNLRYAVTRNSDYIHVVEAEIIKSII